MNDASIINEVEGHYRNYLADEAEREWKCAGCGQLWPCTTQQLIEEMRRLRGKLADTPRSEVIYPAALAVDAIRSVLSTWLTLVLDVGSDGPTTCDLLALREWIDGGCVGEPPWPGGDAPSGDSLPSRTAERTTPGTGSHPDDFNPSGRLWALTTPDVIRRNHDNATADPEGDVQAMIDGAQE